MDCYLIDYENVNQSGINGIEHLKLTESDKIIIYYSDSANSLTFELHNKLANSKANIKYIKIPHPGKNALDFILVYELGRLTVQTQNDCYYIVSKDNGYDNVIEYINKHYKCSVKKIKSMSQNIVNTNKKATLTQEVTDSMLIGMVENEEIEKVQAIIDKYATKRAIHNNLGKAFGERGKEIYENIKVLLNDKK